MSYGQLYKQRQKCPGLYIRLPFVYSSLYVAGFGEEFDRAHKARTLLEKSVVFYRTESGELTSLQNRCLHRPFPLSKGYLEGDHPDREARLPISHVWKIFHLIWSA